LTEIHFKSVYDLQMVATSLLGLFNNNYSKIDHQWIHRTICYEILQINHAGLRTINVYLKD